MTGFPRALAPVDRPEPPVADLPQGAVDAHVHMVGDDMPLWDGRVEDPARGSLDDWIARFETHLEVLGLSRAVIVHSILYGPDNTVTVETVRRMGRNRAAGIGLARDGAPEAELDALAEAGVVGVRLNYVHGGVLSWEGAKALAPALAERGMHVQMLLNAHRHMEEIASDVAALPVPVVFDHLAWPDLDRGVAEPGFAALCRLVGEGKAWVKVSAPYRLCPPPWDAADGHIAALMAANPERCFWGSDWPHVMLADAAQPDAGALLNHVLGVVTGADDRRRLFVDNPASLYGFAP